MCLYCTCIYIYFFIQVSPAQKTNKAGGSSTIDIYDIPGPSTSRRYSSVYLHPDRARFNNFSSIASSSPDPTAVEVYICFALTFKYNGNIIPPL